MLDGLSGELWTPEQDGSRSGWSDEGELVESQALSSGLQDPLPGGLSEAKGAHAHLRDVVETNVVRDGSNQNSDLAVLSFHELGQLRARDAARGRERGKRVSRGKPGVGNTHAASRGTRASRAPFASHGGDSEMYLGQGQRRLVRLAHKESLENDLVELGIGSSNEKLVELDEELQVDVVRLWSSPALALVSSSGNQVNRHGSRAYGFLFFSPKQAIASRSPKL